MIEKKSISPIRLLAVGVFVALITKWGYVHQRNPQPPIITAICTNHRIDFIRTYASSNEFLAPQTGLEKLIRLVFGSEREPFVHPFAFAGQDTNVFCLLDQGASRVILIDRTKQRTDEFLESPAGRFQSLVGVCPGETGEFFFTDSKLNKIFRCTVADRRIEEVRVSEELVRPTGIAYDTLTKILWVVESNTHHVSLFTRDGNLKKRIGQRGTGNGEFNYPTFLCANRDRSFSIVDAMNFRIQRFTAEGRFISAFGSAGDATGYFASIKGIATDSHDNLYIADARFHAVQIFDSTGTFLYNFGKHGSNEGAFWMPIGIWVDAHDKIFVADSYNRRIQEFQLIHE